MDCSQIELGPTYIDVVQVVPSTECHSTAGWQALFGKFSTKILSQVWVLYAMSN